MVSKMGNKFFELRGKLDKKTETVIGLVGLFIIMSIWAVATELKLIPQTILPSPFKVLGSYVELHFQDALVRNAGYSLYLNILGYIEAVAISLPIGFAIALIPIVRGLFKKYIDAMRYIPLTATTGLFIAWYGIYTNMKVQFLAFGIMVYLLPVVIQRVEEVEDVYVDTVYTLGASKWQTVKSVFMPAVFAKISDDIRVLVAISWTYIIVAELVNKQGGLGDLIYTSARQSRIDKVFALLLLIIVIGFVQDKIFVTLDKIIFPYKHILKGRGE